jgi:hypothetical protein
MESFRYAPLEDTETACSISYTVRDLVMKLKDDI